jgi:hypothetical protein
MDKLLLHYARLWLCVVDIVKHMDTNSSLLYCRLVSLLVPILVISNYYVDFAKFLVCSFVTLAAGRVHIRRSKKNYLSCPTDYHLSMYFYYSRSYQSILYSSCVKTVIRTKIVLSIDKSCVIRRTRL